VSQQAAQRDETLNEYRCTFPELYPKPADGHRNPKHRQGHYVDASSEEEAQEIMRKRYPHGTQVIEAELVKRGRKA
jgi:hypothetical protein